MSIEPDFVLMWVVKCLLDFRVWMGVHLVLVPGPTMTCFSLWIDITLVLGWESKLTRFCCRDRNRLDFFHGGRS